MTPTRPAPHSRSARTDVLRDFAAAVEPRLEGDLRLDQMTRALYATDASLYQIMPLAVLLPRSGGDVQLAVEEAARRQLPLLPRGGGSSLAGQTVAAAVILDFSRYMDAVLDFNEEERAVRAQPGIVVDRLNAYVARRSPLMLGPDPASSNRATLGGLVGNNATGTHSILYGNTVDHVRCIRALLADGSDVSFAGITENELVLRSKRSGLEGSVYADVLRLRREHREVIARDTPVHWRRNSGYRAERLLSESLNLSHLLCGSEGTLAVSTEIEIGLVERPARTALGIVHFETRPASLRAVTRILETSPSAVELFDGIAIEQCRRSPGFARLLTFIEGEPGAVLITEYYGSDENELISRLEALEAVLPSMEGAYALVRAIQPQEIANVWDVRKEGLGLIMSVKGEFKPVPFIEDASVPVEHLAEYIDGLTEAADATQTRMAMYAHASAGTLHVRPFINTKDAVEVKKMEELAEASMWLVRKYGGSVSSEHGDGIARSWLIEPLVGSGLYEVYRQIKRSFDPQGILNPEKIIDPPPMSRHLRMGPGYETIQLEQEFDYTEDGGLAGAVELCNGNGACRKLDSGTMCPSFMVTREEQDSTRGRANALRAAMSGLLPVEELTGRRIYEVMDLCIQCKACKSECPSNVDLAKLKSEWLAKYWQTNRIPLRTRLFAQLPQWAARISGSSAGVFSRMNRNRGVRFGLERMLGITARRSLPAFARESFVRWFRRQTWASDGPEVVLFPDTFSNYQHPEVAKAAALWLNRAGFTVIVPDAPMCCGRTNISKGFLARARQLALGTTEVLAKYAERGVPVVGLEPSCILTFRDEFVSLLPGDPRVRALAAVSSTFEEFVADRIDDDRKRRLTWQGKPRRILLHGHCHQKSMVGMKPAQTALSLPPGYVVDTIDSGCCGMAGAFGYEEEHVEISLAMAERRLAPAVRAVSEETIIAAAGTSCRAQIFDTTGRRALHPAQVLLDALGD